MYGVFKGGHYNSGNVEFNGTKKCRNLLSEPRFATPAIRERLKIVKIFPKMKNVNCLESASFSREETQVAQDAPSLE